MKRSNRGSDYLDREDKWTRLEKRDEDRPEDIYTLLGLRVVLIVRGQR